MIKGNLKPKVIPSGSAELSSSSSLGVNFSARLDPLEPRSSLGSGAFAARSDDRVLRSVGSGADRPRPFGVTISSEKTL